VAGHLLLRARRAAHALGLRQRPAIDLSPLFGLRLRTPRLELRFPDEDELVALGRLAEQGVHPPEEMPFFVAWTDAIGQPQFVDGFVAFHRLQREQWRPERWHLLLGVWAEGELAGTQALDGERFAAERTAETGSWLGQAFQGRGYGTEMRAAILALFFDGLGGEVATSGALEGNVASARVSEKLGYVRSGEGTAAPRGVPVREQKFRLERARWRPPFEVEIAGLEPCLPLFGL
jgi:RimJ/RimL family protein N-acetyltransferase